MKPIINHSPIWSTNKKTTPRNKKNGKHHQRKNYFYSVRAEVHPLQAFPYHVRAEVKEPHRTARIAEELQQDRLQIHGEDPWKGLRYVNTHCLFHDISNHKKVDQNPPSLPFWYCIFLSFLVTFKDASNMERSTVPLKTAPLAWYEPHWKYPNSLVAASSNRWHLPPVFRSNKNMTGVQASASGGCVLQSGPRKIQL